MTSILKTDEIQSQNGGSVVKMQTLKHPSSSGNNLELASDGNVSLNGTLSAGTIGGDVSMASSGLTVRNFEQKFLTSNQSLSGSDSGGQNLTTFWSPTYNPKFSSAKILIEVCMCASFGNNTQNTRMQFKGEITGSDITDITFGDTTQTLFGVYDYGGDGIQSVYARTITFPAVTTTGTSTITVNLKLQNPSINTIWTVYGTSGGTMTNISFTEFK
tara:strand:- start:7 stop:654 length:648 start_codon:yes stop_codon:yes gene_type:complete